MYDCALDVRSLVSLERVMDEFELGPNGGIMYCMEYLAENVDWLIDEGQVTGGIHEAVSEAQKVVESGWVMMIQPPTADSIGAKAADGEKASRPGDMFALSAVYKTCEMRWVEVGRTGPSLPLPCPWPVTTARSTTFRAPSAFSSSVW